MGKVLLEKGDIVFTMEAPLGNALLIPDSQKYILSQRVVAFKTKKTINNSFLIQLIWGKHFQNNIEKLSTGSTAKGINQKTLGKVNIFIPTSSEEQQKIADCLSSLDELITAENQKLEAFKTHKKGLMQQLFPAEGETVPKLRFAEFRDGGDWEEDTLENLSTKISDGIHATPVYDDNGAYYFINGNNLINGKISINENTKKVSENEYIKHKRDLNDNSILLSINGTIGNMAVYSNEKVILGKSACYINNDESKANKIFIIYFLQTKKVTSYFDTELTGSTIKNLSLRTIKNTMINLPKPQEQQKIADCLSSLDELITAQTEKIATLKMHKKGLMQGLFPSINESGG